MNKRKSKEMISECYITVQALYHIILYKSNNYISLSAFGIITACVLS